MHFVEVKCIAENPISYVSDSSSIKPGRMETKIYSFPPDHNELVPKDGTPLAL